jgi:hypothetical protein
MRKDHFGHGFGCCETRLHHHEPRARYHRHWRPWRRVCLTKEEKKELLEVYKDVLEKKLAKINRRLEEINEESGKETKEEEA